MPDGRVIAMLLVVALLVAVAHTMHGWQGAAWALVGVAAGVLALALWTMLEGG